MNNHLALQEHSALQMHQIAYLEYCGDRLYTEVIQVIPTKGTCWARPLALVTASRFMPLADGLPDKTGDSPVLHDLRYASDLLLPLSLFHPAMDVDVLPWLGEIYAASDRSPIADSATQVANAQCYLNQFVLGLYQVHPEQFQIHLE
jgi:hypothetical protein